MLWGIFNQAGIRKSCGAEFAHTACGYLYFRYCYLSMVFPHNNSMQSHITLCIAVHLHSMNSIAGKVVLSMKRTIFIPAEVFLLKGTSLYSVSNHTKNRGWTNAQKN